MDAACEGCRHRFFVQGAGTEAVACPDCGGHLAPERDQPSGSIGDGELHNPYTEKQMSNNPLQEGMLGGWQNREKRDESFASVKEAGTPIKFNRPEDKLLWRQLRGTDIKGHQQKWTPGMRGRALMVGPYQHSWNSIDPETAQGPEDMGLMHGEYGRKLAEDHGIDDSMIDYTTGVEIDPDGTIDNSFGRDISHHLESDPRLKDGGTEKKVKFTFGSLDQTIHTPWDMQKEADILDSIGDVGNAIGDQIGQAADYVSGEGDGGIIGEGLTALKDHPLDTALTAAMFLPGVGTAASLGARAALSAGRAALGAKLFQGAKATESGLAAGAEAGAAEAGAGTKALDSFKNSVKNAPKDIGKRIVRNEIANALTPGKAPGQAAPAGGLQEAPDLSYVTHVAATDTPTSLTDIPGAKSGDPEDADTQEFNAESDTTNPENPERDEAGGATTPDNEKKDGKHESPALTLLEHFLPQIMAYYVSDESGEHDPIIRAVDEALEKEFPGYSEGADKDHSDLHHVLESYLTHHDGKVAAYNALAAGNAVVPPPVAPAAGPNPQLHQCPACKVGMLDARGTCPQCGFGGQPNAQQVNRAVTPPLTAKVADTQGPVTPEQQKAVAEYLISQGRSAEIPTMLDPNSSWQYADELAQIQRRTQTPPPTVALPSQPPAPPGMGMGGPPPGGGAPPGGDPSQQIASAVSRFAADNIARRCPYCDSATTGVVSEDACKCHACKKQWKVDLTKTVARTADTFDHQDLHATPLPDEADNETHDHAEDDVTYNWETADGTRLEPGKEYEMHSENYSVPDIVKVVAVKPNELVYRIEGEFADLEDEGTIDRQTAKLEGLSFVPVDNADASDPVADSAESRPRTNTEPTSTSAVPVTSSVNPIYNFSNGTAPITTGTTSTNGSAMTVTFGNEAQAPTKVEPPAEADWLLEGSAAAVPAPWETPLPDLTGGDVTASADGADWLLEGMPSAKVAGAKFSPQEQREFIDEEGEARNLDRLDLEGTHYRTRETSVFVAGRGKTRHAQPDMVREEDFALGF